MSLSDRIMWTGDKADVAVITVFHIKEFIKGLNERIKSPNNFSRSMLLDWIKKRAGEGLI